MKITQNDGKKIAVISLLLLMIPLMGTWMFSMSGEGQLVSTYPANPAPGEVQKNIYFAASSFGGHAYFVAPILNHEFVTEADARAYIDSLNGVGVIPGNIAQEGSITIYVKSSSAHVPGVTVKANGETKTTNPYGIANFARVPLGTYTVEVSKSGYNSRSITAEVKEVGETVSKVVDLSVDENPPPINDPPYVPPPTTKPNKVAIAMLHTEGGTLNYPQGGYFPRGDAITVKAYPDAGYEFSNWEVNGNIEGTGSPSIMIDCEEDYIVKGVFRSIANPNDPVRSGDDPPIIEPPTPGTDSFGGIMMIIGIVGIIVGAAVYVYLKK